MSDRADVAKYYWMDVASKNHEQMVKLKAQRDDALFALSALMSEVEGIMPIDSDSPLAQAYDAAHAVREKLFQS